jgi:hypothetical protein
MVMEEEPMTNEAILDALVSEACISLFNDYSLPLRRVAEFPQAEDSNLSYCAVVGFGGDQIRGSLLLATTAEPLGRTSPVGDTCFRDWIAELSNQLLGRIKTKLVARGIVPHASTPVVLRAPHLTPLPKATMKHFVFECDDGHVCVWLEAELEKNLDLTLGPVSTASLNEGEGLLF